MKNTLKALTTGFLGLTVGACALAPAEEFNDETALDEEVSSKDQAIFGSKSCKNPQIDVFNTSDSGVRIKALKFYDLTKKTWRSEDVANTTIPAEGGMRFRDNLDNAKNRRIGDWQIKLDNGDWLEATVLDGYNRECVSNAGTRYAIQIPRIITKVIIN